MKSDGRGLELKCPWCGYQGKFKSRTFDIMSGLICAVLILFFLVPGALYGIWHALQEECPNCRAQVPRGPF